MPGNGPWAVTDRFTLLFANRAALQTIPQNPIGEDENGLLVNSGVDAWTNTNAGGLLASANPTLDCEDWSEDGAFSTAGNFPITGKVGAPVSDGNAWTTNGELGCSVSAHLICFEQ